MTSQQPEMTSSQQKRIFLWAVPRSLSSAMCRVMMNSGLRTQIIFEPYSASHYFGPEREECDRYQHIQPNPKYSYTKVRDELLAPYPDKELVFVKDHALYLRPNHLTSHWLPDSYLHTFITRHPAFSVPSAFKVMEQVHAAGDIDASECGYEEQALLARLLRDRGDRVIVLDADDLMDNPEGTLRAYCQAVGLDYTDSMVNWKPMEEEEYKSVFCQLWPNNWFDALRTSSKLARRPKKAPPAHVGPDVTSDPETRDLLQGMVDDNMKYYEELCAFRLQPHI